MDTRFKKGMIPWNKGTRKILVCFQCKKSFLPKQRKPHQKYCSLRCLGISKRGNKHPLWLGGKPQCKGCDKEIRWDHKFCKGCYKKENHHWWKGGITPINALIRSSKEYEECHKKTKSYLNNRIRKEDYLC